MSDFLFPPRIMKIVLSLHSLEGEKRSKACAEIHKYCISKAAKEAAAFKKANTQASKAIGGHARAANLTPEERSAIASKAAKARWENKK